LKTLSSIGKIDNVEFSAGNSEYSSSASANRQAIIEAYHWNITDGGEEP